MAGKKPYRMNTTSRSMTMKAKPPAPAPAPKKSFKNTLGDAFEDATDYAKRSKADAEDAYDAVRRKLKSGSYRQTPDPATGKTWPFGRGENAVRADATHGYHLLDRKQRDTPPPLPPATAPAPKRAPVASAAPKAAPQKPAPKTIDPGTADQEIEGGWRPNMADKAIKAHPPAGEPGSQRERPSMAVRKGDIVQDRGRALDKGMKGYRLPAMGDKTEALNVTVGGRKKTVRLPKAGKVKL